MKRIALFIGLAALLLALAILAGCRSQPPAGSPGAETVPAIATTRAPTPALTAAPSPRPPSRLVATAGMPTALDAHPPQASFILHFSQPVDPASSAQPVRFTPAVRGQATWDATCTTLTFTPDSAFQGGRTYEVTLDPALRSESGLELAGRPRWQLAVRYAPAIIRRTPGGREGTDRRPAFDLGFSRPMDQASVAAAFSVEPAVPYRLEWADQTLSVVLQEPLASGTAYQFTLSRTAADLDGVGLLGDYVWIYWLKDALARIEKPTANAPDAPITLTFNYPLRVASVRQALQIEPAVAGHLSWDLDQQVFTFTPAERLGPQTDYTISFGGELLDAGGLPLVPPEPVTFTTVPAILETQPTGQAVNPAMTIAIRFDRPMDQAATEAAVEISPAADGVFEWQETTLTFRPAAGQLAENTSYFVTVQPTARSADGERVLTAPHRWHFQTAGFQPIVSFGYGPNAQVLDANGRRAIQFVSAQRQPLPVTFDLYRLNLTQFLDRYSSGFKGVGGWEFNPISTEGTQLVRSWEMETAASSDRWHHAQETIIPADVPPGLYILNLSAGRLNAQLIIVLSQNTLAVKRAGNQLVAWVTDINGGPVPGLEVGVYARDGSLLRSGRADDNGVFRAELPPFEQGGPPSIDPLVVVARQGEDLTSSGLTPEWRSDTFGYWGWWQPEPAAPEYAAYLYTDRPIYKPGQTVFFKAIIRRDDDAVLDLPPAGTPLTVRVRDARDNVVQTISLAINDFGSATGSFDLAEGAMLGNYRLEVVLGRESHSQAFKVEDYRKPDYQVIVTTGSGKYVEGDRIAVTVEARYFFGEPVAGAAVSLAQFWAEHGYDWRGEPIEFGWYADWGDPLRGTTDADGRYTFTIPARLYNYDCSRLERGDDYYGYPGNAGITRWAVEATVSDASNQAVSGSAAVEVYCAAERVTLNTGGYAQQPGRPFTVAADVRDIFSEPVANRQLTLELLRWDAGNYGYTILVQSAALRTGSNGHASLQFAAEEPGFYRVRLRGRDDGGRLIVATSWLYVFSDFYANWYGRGQTITIAADRDSYAPGETARLLVESEFGGPALLTFERGTTRRELLIELTPPLTVVEVPIQPDDVPNVHVVVNAWQEQDTTLTEETYNSLPDSRLRRAAVNLLVPATTKVLNVAITTDREAYAPREEATFTVRVTNYRGEPVSAELSLAMVDEAIFALSEELSGPIYDGFYFNRRNYVRTFDSLALERYLGGNGMGGGNGGNLPGGPRRDFPDTAAWFPTLMTNANGEVRVTVTLPDSLTTWRLTAKVATADTQVGDAIHTFLVRQPVVVQPFLPRGLTAGDAIQLSALVHNYSETTLELAVALTVSDTALLELGTPVTQSVTLRPGQVEVVGWAARAAGAGQTTVVFSATPQAAGVQGDAIALVLPIRPLAIPDVTTQLGEFAGELATTVDMPAAALPMSGVEIQLTRSIAGSLLQGLEYLIGFPYGCVEQTMSKALPNAVVGRALNRLGVTDPTLTADLPARINASVQRLYGFQHNDGGWGWWFDDDTHPYQTAWVIFGLATTAEAGYEIDPLVIERGVTWLDDNLEAMDVRTRAFALFSMALAGHGNEAATLALASRPDDLDPFSQAALALALHHLGRTAEARQVVVLLAEKATVEDGLVYWPGETDDGYYDRKTMASTTRNTAIALSAFTAIRPGHELEAGMVRYLMSQRRQAGWGTTNETAFAIIGLTDHLLATSFSEAATETTIAVRLNGVEVAAGRLGRGEPAVTLTIPRAQLAAGANSLVISHSGNGRLFYLINSRVYLAQEAIDPAGVIEVSREYVDPGTGRPVRRIVPGQLVRVRLTVTMPRPGSYLIVEDSLPGGLEALNERLDTTAHVGRSSYDETTYYWREYGYNHKEVYGDRVTFFITEVDAGQRTFTYYARATHAGTFTAMPAEVSAMYDLSLWGRSASTEAVVSER